MVTDKKIAVIGGGAWGTALGVVSARAGNSVTLWARNEDVIADINRNHRNALYLPGVDIDSSVTATSDIENALFGAEAALVVVPAQHLRSVLEQMKPYADTTPVIVCSKGVERESLALMSEVARDVLPDNPLAVLSGPTFAKEVASGLPTAVTLATEDENLSRIALAAVGTPMFRPYTSDDVVGVEIAGAAKNVVAIACGIVMGRQLGENARAALITRGLAEISRLGVAAGGRLETFMGLSGVGDICLTCNSAQSRNTSFGIALGEGRTLEEILGERRAVTEGVWSAAAVTGLAARLGVDMPIAGAVAAVVEGRADIDSMIEALLSRPFSREI